jgi:hypothetical protein
LDDPDIAEQFERHLNSPKLTWVLGAGVSFNANIPLMYPLTEQVLKRVKEDVFLKDEVALHVIDFVVNDTEDDSHIEDHLTYLGDYISLAERSQKKRAIIGDKEVPREKLVEVHNALLELIADIVRWGYKPAKTDDEQNIVEPEVSGSKDEPIVDVGYHRKFIRAVFGKSRAGIEYLRQPVEFFTTNYDTLLEDALALERIPYRDGFTGGGIGFWSTDAYAPRDGTRAIVTKLHGSIDWYRDGTMPSPMLRVRPTDSYPRRNGGAVMIYPQATKYLNTQRDPFAELFQRFRNRLAVKQDHVLVICGYSFGDEHINAEIENAMAAPDSQLTIVALANEVDSNLPLVLKHWTTKFSWRNRVFVASQNGLYQGDSGPHFTGKHPSDWWTFSGATKLFETGLPSDIQKAIE